MRPRTTVWKYVQALEEMGLDFISRWQERPEGFFVDGTLPNPIPVDGSDYLYRLDASFDPDSVRVETMLDSSTGLSLAGTQLQIKDVESDRILGIDLATSLVDLSMKEEQGEAYGPEETRLEAEDSVFRLVVYLDNVRAGGEGDSLKINQISAVVLVTRRQ